MLPEPTSGVVSGNAVIIIGDDGVLVVDTGRFPSLARKMIAEIRHLTDKPVRTIVTTHWHPDHNLGNAEYARAFPGVTILAHSETRRLVLKNLPKQVEIQRRSRETLDQLNEASRRGKHKDGTPFTDDEKAYIAATVPALEATLADADALTLVPPSATFDGDSVNVFLGRREFGPPRRAVSRSSRRSRRSIWRSSAAGWQATTRPGTVASSSSSSRRRRTALTRRRRGRGPSNRGARTNAAFGARKRPPTPSDGHEARVSRAGCSLGTQRASGYRGKQGPGQGAIL